jgi:signal transduction histidine kinase
MTIRFKLTLVYSVIIALILIGFSVILYSTQRWTTMNSAQKNLVRQYYKIADSWPSAASLETVSSAADGQHDYDQAYAQVRNWAGQITHRPSNIAGTTFPLSDHGLEAVKQGQAWIEPASLEGGRFLIRSKTMGEPGEKSEILQVALSVESRYQFLTELRNTLIIGDSLVILVALGVGWLVAGLTLRPIHRITQTAKTVGEERDFGQRVENSGPADEIGQLATTFNDMLGQLQDAYLKVEQSLQAQRRFVADASHELRTPLTTIRGNLDLLQRQPPIAAQDQADILTDTVSETERLIRLVNDLLLLARADSKQPLRREPVQTQALLEDLCRQATLLAPQRTIVCRPVPDLYIAADPDALKQVLLVLLDNALKHTPSQATITLATSAAGEEVYISVQDNGPGIEPSQLPHLFERFYRGDASRSGPGTGLGLAIAEELTKAQNGSLTVESQQGQNTTFTLTFPRFESSK